MANTLIPPPASAYVQNAGSWSALTSTDPAAAVGPVFTPPPAGLYAYNNALGQWVPWSGSSGGGGLAQIAKVTVAADTNQVSIAAIPNTFSHLQLLALFPQRGANGSSGINLQFNADTTNTHYCWQCVIGANNNPPTSQAAGFTDSSINIGQLSGNDNGANAVAVVTLQVVGYASLTTGKGVTGLNYSTGNAGSSQTFTIAGQYLSLSAITSIQINATGGSNYIKAGTVLTLYGML